MAMKKSLLFILFAAGAAAAAPLPVGPMVYSPARAAAPKPARAAAAPAEDELGRYTVDLNIGYAFRGVPDSKYACDMVCAELEGAYFVLPHHALTLSVGVAGGGETNDFWVVDHHGVYPFTDSYDRTSLTLMGGYRYSRTIGRYGMVQLGAKCGMDVQTLNVDYGYGWSGYPYCDDDRGKDGTSVGMAYAGYVNVGAFVSRRTCFYVGYQFRGSTARPSVNSGFPDTPKSCTSTMRWHEVRLGATFHF